MQIDLRVAELLASRLCHDLVGPIGAVNNGMELLTDDEFGMADDALQLASSSARRAADSLQFFRLAYGMAGSRVGGDLSELRALATAHLKTTKTELDWPDMPLPSGAPDDLGKLLLNMIELGQEALPRGGKLTIGLAEAGGGVAVDVTASGEGAQLREEAAAVMSPEASIDELTPRNVHGYFTCLVTSRLGSSLEVDASATDSIRLHAQLPA